MEDFFGFYLAECMTIEEVSACTKQGFCNSRLNLLTPMQKNLSRTLVCEIPGIKICLQARNFILCGLIYMREMFHLSALRILLAPVFDFIIFYRMLGSNINILKKLFFGFF